MNVYFDNSATTKVSKESAEIAIKVMTEDFGNPSSLHMKGVEAERYIKDSKEIISGILKVQPKEILFTSGGTESNNLAIIGAANAAKRRGNRIITTSVEHPSVLRPLEYLESQGFEIVKLKTDESGRVSADDLKDALTPDTILVTSMFVNNEVGAVMPIEEMGRCIKEYNKDIIFHVDAIQAFGKYRIYPKKMNIDLLSVSGHKIHAPKGIGFLYVNSSVRIVPVIYGGGQQQNLRSGTENVPGIAALGVAAKQCYDDFDEKVSKMVAVKDKMIDELSMISGVTVHSKKGDGGAPHIVNVAFSNIRSEVMLHALEEYGIYISAGSACSSNGKHESDTLKSMGLSKDEMGSSVRFSFSSENTLDEAEYAIEKIKALVPMLQKYVRR